MSYSPEKIEYYALQNLDNLPQFARLPKEKQFEIKVVSTVLPFRVNNYVVNHLIDWDKYEDDPMFRLTFMNKQMLPKEDFSKMAEVCTKEGSFVGPKVSAAANEIRLRLNPHPSGQLTSNVPLLDGQPVEGIQHKYTQTCLVFPKQGQTCHSHCTFCFRWPQFAKMPGFKFSTGREKTYLDYLKAHKEISDVLVTGGDPMVMPLRHLADYIEPLLSSQFDHIQAIRIGSKALTFWPQRFVSDKDSDDILKLFEKITKAGKTLAFMAHINHHREIEDDIPQQAIKAIQGTGAIIRSQSPLLRHVNDDAKIWSTNWNLQVKLGIVPYYMFVERDTGSREYFGLPLVKALDIYRDAIRDVSGLARTARGPSMSCHPGKVNFEDIQTIGGKKVMVFKFLQARNPEWTGKTFFAKYDPQAQWLDDLVAFKEKSFFFDEDSWFPGIKPAADLVQQNHIN